jgi:hypothetical protein
MWASERLFRKKAPGVDAESGALLAFQIWLEYIQRKKKFKQLKENTLLWNNETSTYLYRGKLTYMVTSYI